MNKCLQFVLCLVLVLASVAGAGDTWVVTTDFSSFGRLRDFSGTEPWSMSADLATIPGDAVARHHNGMIYVVGRGGANLLQVYDPAAGFALVREFSLGAGRNPQDIAFDSAGTAYVSCYDKAVMLQVDVPNENIVAIHSTAAYADADGLPETSWMLAHGDKIYLTCQKLDRNNWYAPTGPGQLLVFDPATGLFETPIDLIGADPYTQIEVVAVGDGEAKLRVGCAGFFGLADGGIETIDLVNGVSLGYDVTEAELGGDITSFATTGDGVLHVLISNASYVTSLRRYVLATDELTVLATGSGYVYADIAFDGGFQLYLADRTAGAFGLRVFDAVSGAQLTTGLLDTGLPPFMVVLPAEKDPSAVPSVPALGDLDLSLPFPNPCNPRSELVLKGQAGCRVVVSVFDLRGRRVSEQPVRLDATGVAVWTFTGADSRGRNLPTGVYRVVVQSGGGFAARSVTLVK